MKPWAQNLLISLASVIVTLVIFVLVYELYSSNRYDAWKADYLSTGDWYGNLTIPSDNEVLLWQYRPDSVGNKWNTEVRTNSAGFRDREHTLERTESALRIAFGGDSTTVGVGATQDAIYARRFEELADIARPEQPTEALAFAVDGYSAVQVLELIRTRSVDYSPDIVVYVLCLNDFDFEQSSGQKIRFFKKPDSFLLEMLERAWLGLSGVNYYSYFYSKNKDEVFATLRETQTELREMGIDFRVATLPIFGGPGSATDYPYDDIFRDLLANLEADGIPTIDLRTAFMETGEAPTNVSTDTLHMNEAGHRFVAEHLIRELL